MTEMVRHKDCAQCGKAMTRAEKGANFKRAKYCSIECMSLATRFTPERAARAFWGRVDKTAGPDACWPYCGAITTHGYGCTQWQGRVLGAHKVAYLLTKGEVQAGLQIRHSCDNPLCCNPAHLSTGTIQDNANDKVARGRTPKTFRKKLNPTLVREIRALQGVASSGEIAAKYGIDQSHTFAIWGRKVWKGVE